MASRIRIRLIDVAAWLPAIAVAATVWREAEFSATSWPAGDASRNLGLFAATLAVFLGMDLLRQAIGCMRARSGDDSRPWIVPIVWRLAVVVELAIFLSEEARVVRRDGTYWLPETRIARESLRLTLPLGATLAMVGVVAGTTWGRPVRRSRLAWLSIIGATVVGILAMASQAIIPYLVMTAIEAVDHAMVHRISPPGTWPSVYRRLMRAAGEGLVVVSLGIVLAIWVSRVLRRSPPDPGEPDRSRRDSIILALLTGATALGALRLVTVTIPRWQVQMVEGMQILLTPPALIALALGFAGLAAGIAARAADLPGSPSPPVRSARWQLVQRVIGVILKVLLAWALIDVIIARVFYESIARGDISTHWIGWVDVTYRRLQPTTINPSGIGWIWSPDVLVFVAAQIWLGSRIVFALVMPARLELTPLDVALASRASFVRFGLRWLALFVLMITAIPAFVVEGMALYHIILHRSW